MTDRDQLVQLRSLPSNRLARRHPGELMIPIRLAGDGPPVEVGFGVLGLTTGWIGRLSSGVGIDMIPDATTPCTLTVRGGFNVSADGRTNMGLMGTNVADQNVRVLGLTDQVGVGATLFPFTGVDWSNFELVLVGQDTGGGTFQVDELTVNGIPTDFALPVNAGTAAFFAFANVTRICDVANEVDDQIGHRWDAVRFQTTDGFDYDFRLEEGAGAFFNSSGDFWENPTLSQPADFNLTEDVDWTWVDSADPLPGPPPPPLEVGLVSQADVNTRGRTDDLPFDHVSGLVSISTGGHSGTGVGVGGAIGMQMTNSAGTIEFTPPDLSFLTGDFTVAWRAEPSGGGIGRGTLARIYSSADDDDAISVGRGLFQGNDGSSDAAGTIDTDGCNHDAGQQPEHRARLDDDARRYGADDVPGRRSMYAHRRLHGQRFCDL